MILRVSSTIIFLKNYNLLLLIDVRFNMYMDKMCGNLSQDSELHLIHRICKPDIDYIWPLKEVDTARAITRRFESRIMDLLKWTDNQPIFKGN